MRIIGIASFRTEYRLLGRPSLREGAVGGEPYMELTGRMGRLRMLEPISMDLVLTSSWATAERITSTERRIRPYIRRTPTLSVDSGDFGLEGISIILKLEFVQHAGSFKVRGAFANLLGSEVPSAGVVAASGGNHGAAVGYAAMKLGIPARIFVPRIASPAKIKQIRGYGAELTIVGDRYVDALEASRDWMARSGAMPVHAYDQVETLVGQGTTGLEWEEQTPQLDTILVSVGGGGLIGGIAAWYASRINVIGVEPEAAPTLHDALAAGQPVDAPVGGIAAESLGARRVGQLMFPIAKEHVQRAVLVDDDQIRTAQAMLWKSLRVVTEPGGAAAFAALASGRYQPSPGERVGVLLCGANTVAVDFHA